MSRSLPRPLPRTLVPLSGESLPGYILRLSYRLDLTAAQLCAWAGLCSHSESGWSTWPPTGPMICMPQRQIEVFALACGLSLGEARSLTMAHMARRYPPVGLAPVAAGHKQRTPRGIAAGDPWVTTRVTRYCPQCLAGDGSPVQEQYGGAWQSRWRFAVSFACTRHQRLLEWDCPDCGTPAQSMDPIYQTTLIPTPNGMPVHPATCRSGRWRQGDYCGTRLDGPRPAVLAGRSTALLVALQNRLDQILDGTGPRPRSLGHRVSAPTYFTDLRVTARLVQAAFPCSLVGSVHRRGVEPYLFWHELEGQQAQRDYLAPLLRGHYAENDIPPFRSDALGCLMLLAAEFLDARSPDAIAERADKFLARSGFTRRHVRLLANTPRLSERMRSMLLTRVGVVPTAVVGEPAQRSAA